MNSAQEIAVQFGVSLDQDDFATTASLLTSECTYQIADTELRGPTEICNSYEQNMLEGRKKLDQLEWGTSRIEPINESEFYVHFTDYLTHQEQKYTHRCKQKLTVSDAGKISRIEHIYDPEEQARLDAWYRSVGLK